MSLRLPDHWRQRSPLLKPMVLVALVVASVAWARAEEWRTRRVLEPGALPVVFQYRPRTEGELSELVRFVTLARERFHALAETTLSVELHVVVASSERDFADLTDGMIPDWGAALAVPGERLIVVALNSPSKPLGESVVHEVSHVLLGSMAEHPIPRWFDEGLAMYLAGEWTIYDSFRLARGSLGRGLLPLARIDNVLTFHQDEAWLAYSESFGAVSWLAEQFGREALGKIIRLLPSMPFDEALFTVTGMAGHAFEETWLRRTRYRYALVGLADDVWLWSIVIPALFFLALGVRWWRNRSTVRRWREEEDDDGKPDEPLDEQIAETY